ncbi:hypothetical protein LWE61_20360 [Sphingobium sufflavum]|uniref:hypothetical protein n=1 Tax=Sphingobium sufflavum TaxID=1129547 RepID=UPI001F2551E1|nr:hypothetical protein [Sphingobium sufflavum]MCE7798886.1 hypothetical protein [Sphingobium sufflavum]
MTPHLYFALKQVIQHGCTSVILLTGNSLHQKFLVLRWVFEQLYRAMRGTIMALPPRTSPCWQRLATGGLERIKTENLGTRMLIKRIEMSKSGAPEKAAEIFEYYTKWERGLAHEIAQFA